MSALEVTVTADSLVPALPSSPDHDLVALLLADKRSENTRRAYQRDVIGFFQAMYAGEPTPARVREFLALDTGGMVGVLLRYKALLLTGGRAEATVNRRLSAMMSLVGLARKVGATHADPRTLVSGEKTRPYRDTRGLDLAGARRLLSSPDRSTLKGSRDYALLLLLLENGLRRNEIVTLGRRDFDAERRTLSITGKGRGTQRELVTLSPTCVAAILSYLALRGSGPVEQGSDADGPLFASVSRAHGSRALTADGLRKLVEALARDAKIEMHLSPHRLRHTAITLALDASGGDIRRVQRLSRHAKLDTLLIYDDNRRDLQGEMTNTLSKLLQDEGC